MTIQTRLTRHLIAPLWAAWERSPYLAHYRRLLRSQYQSADAIAAGQLEALRRIATHAASTVPFYQERFRQAGVTPADIGTLDDFRNLPVLTKEELRAQASSLRSTAAVPQPVWCKKTSGSTGQSLAVWVDEASMQFKRACTLRADEWSGWRLGEPVAKVWGNPPYLNYGWRGRLRNALLDRACYLDTLKMNDQTLDTFTNEIRSLRPTLLFGHAHSVFLYAEYVREHCPGVFHPRGIITTAMVLHDWQRQAIETVFDCPVTNRYGCEEVSLVGCECDQHHGFHLNADSVLVEVLVDGRPARPGEPGALVITDLTNRAMPILRYQVGDVGILSERRCPCGRGLPLLERLEGRESDFLVTPAGTMISGISMTENFALLVPGVAQFQIVQEAVDQLLFRIVRTNEYGEASVAKMHTLVEELLGPAVTFRCEYLERIPPEPSGKYRFCRSAVHVPTFGRERPVSASLCPATPKKH